MRVSDPDRLRLERKALISPKLGKAKLTAEVSRRGIAVEGRSTARNMAAALKASPEVQAARSRAAKVLNKYRPYFRPGGKKITGPTALKLERELGELAKLDLDPATKDQIAKALQTIKLSQRSLRNVANDVRDRLSSEGARDNVAIQARDKEQARLRGLRGEMVGDVLRNPKRAKVSTEAGVAAHVRKWTAPKAPPSPQPKAPRVIAKPPARTVLRDAHPIVGDNAQVVKAKLATADGTVPTSWGGDLRFRKGKDYVLQYGPNDFGVVRADIFADTYKRTRGGYVKNPKVNLQYFIADREMHIRTLEGVVLAKPGDHVMVGTRGEMWPVRPDKFRAKYTT